MIIAGNPLTVAGEPPEGPAKVSVVPYSHEGSTVEGIPEGRALGLNVSCFDQRTVPNCQNIRQAKIRLNET